MQVLNDKEKEQKKRYNARRKEGVKLQLRKRMGKGEMIQKQEKK